MTTKYQRPGAGYEGGSGLLNRDKYQSDASAQPKVSISSEKIDGDFNYIIDALNEIDDASGTAASIASRLNQSLNADGSLKASASNVLDDWVGHDVTGLNRVDGSTITIYGDVTSIYTTTRRVRLIVAGVPLFAHVENCSVSASVTTVTFVDITDASGAIQTITETPSEISYSPVFSGDLGNLNYRFNTLKASNISVENESGLILLKDTGAAGETYAMRSQEGVLEFVKNTGSDETPIWELCLSIDESGLTLADNSVLSNQIANGSVTSSKINSGAASSGQVLTADGSGGVNFESLEEHAWELVSDVVVSGSPTVLDITSGFDGDYIHVIYLYDLKFTYSGNMLTRLTNDGGSTFDSASNYSRSLWRQGLSNSSTHGNSQTEFNISDSACNYLSGVITIQNADNALGVTEFKAELHTGTDKTGPQTEGNTSMVIGWHSVYEVHNGIRIFNGSTITNGRYKHYRIKV